MCKQCTVCGKEIMVGTTCMECIKNTQKQNESAASVDYKKLIIRICMVVAILSLSIMYAWITDDSRSQNDTSENANSYLNNYQYDNSNSITSGNTVEKSQGLVSTPKTGAKATDFEVVGGSDNVYIISEKNYGVICPHCGYDGGAMGTSTLWSEISKYKAGETVSMPRWCLCVMKFQGGCEKDFKYTVTVKFK